MTALERPLVSMTDVAAWAGVRRAVVSVWRSRPRSAGGEDPFPAPVRRSGATELFDAEAVADWLERTGRGNNADARADMYAYVRAPSVSSTAVSTIDACEALLALSVATGTALSGLAADEIEDLADEQDPDDEQLRREVESLGEEAPRVAAYVERLIDAAYTPEAALEVLDRRRAQTGPVGRHELTQQARALVGEVTAALCLDLATDSVTIEDATGHGSDLVDAVVTALGERIDTEVLVRGDDDQARSSRRRRLILGQTVLTGANGPRVIVASFPNAGAPDLADAEVLDAIDALQLEGTDAERVVVVASASALCDALSDPAAERARDNALRLGRLRCAVRLPKGLLPGAVRRPLGLWILGPEARSVSPDRRVVMTADLSSVPLDVGVIADLATDVVASISSRQHLHEFRFSRPVGTSELIARRGRLVTLGTRHQRPVRPAEEVLALRGLVATARLEGVRVDGGTGAPVPGISLGDALHSGRARLIPGARLTSAPLPAGTLRLLTSAAVVDGGEVLSVDPLEFARRHPRSQRTAPGDVVFVTSPRPWARVDHDGLAVVAYPARILRFAEGSGLVPAAVAAAINAQPDHAGDWRGWLVPVVGAESAATVGQVLDDIESQRNALRARLEALGELERRVAPAVGGGAITISLDTAENHGNNDVMQYGETGSGR